MSGLPAEAALTPEDFVALAMAQPLESGRATYGYAMRVVADNPGKPECIALTWIAARNDEERARIRDHARQNVQDFLAEPGFVSIVTGFLGLRGFTVTAWTDEDAMRRALSGHHATAMRELFEEDFVGSVWTSVWSSTRFNRLWVRCPSCASLEDASLAPATCTQCESPLPERPSFW